MRRRRVLQLSLPLAAAGCAAPPAPTPRTDWQIGWSEGLDAIALLGPLSGSPFYARHDPDVLARFGPRLPHDVVPTVQRLAAASDAADTLLWPWLALVLSGGPHDTLDAVQASLADAERTLLEPYRTSDHWDAAAWTRLLSMRPALVRVLAAMQRAGFGALWREGQTEDVVRRLQALRQLLQPLDLLSEHERLLGRALPRTLRLTLLQFCRPHGVRVLGQHFLAHVLSSDDVVVLTAAHEVLHPPFDRHGVAVQRCLAVLRQDALLARMLAEKPRETGYNTLDGLFEEDVVQALDQIVQERLGRGRAPRARWLRADDGLHVLAAGLYGLLQADGYARHGGRIEAWLHDAAVHGRLASASWQSMAEQVLGQPPARVWSAAQAARAR